MTNTTLAMNERLQRYLVENTVREAAVLARLRQLTAKMPQASMQIAPEQGQLLQLLVRLIDARRCLEVGTFTGYSALAVALAMPGDGRIVACDVSAEWTAIARRFWAEAGVDSRIDLRLAPALATLDGLLADGHGSSFDFAFIDADKTNYVAYYERVVELLRPGGLLAVDNVLWGGDVADPTVQDTETNAIRALNDRARDDARVDISLVPIGDGLLLARKRG
ncbi:MAG: class I SAM-dependent methyltransferase [Steroidobacteraceae bacterium]|nr:class I SAM-dependent methyltransferase [Steroidobacteraceae bacterium]MCW5573678.1 class I SAM-dependent methyltransferase [Steroidobacteraceae bacterium]